MDDLIKRTDSTRRTRPAECISDIPLSYEENTTVIDGNQRTVCCWKEATRRRQMWSDYRLLDRAESRFKQVIDEEERHARSQIQPVWYLGLNIYGFDRTAEKPCTAPLLTAKSLDKKLKSRKNDSQKYFDQLLTTTQLEWNQYQYSRWRCMPAGLQTIQE